MSFCSVTTWLMCTSWAAGAPALGCCCLVNEISLPPNPKEAPTGLRSHLGGFRSEMETLRWAAACCCWKLGSWAKSSVPGKDSASLALGCVCCCPPSSE
uniref:Putative secreted protein n=1 Tax=Ixodes ricinus TaxID=34613 RepID=A0A6B0UI58_IXORI